ncbi:MAG: substrate-binding domain-containing protein [Roseburia sp.]|nr:substrate-binding domain-containing protein [Roseburia sp.]MCM1278289.1 substrate-binding domain-containing protein [Robinsoniella sp.]
MKAQAGGKANTAALIKAALFLAVLAAFMVACMLYFKMRSAIAGDIEQQEYTHYVRHYAFIADNMENDFWEEVYQGAKERGEETNVYLEWFGSSAAVKYSKKERLQNAIAAKVDGIVLEADESMETLELIDEAVENQIPVVTVMTDSYGSKRQSFIGIASYNLGSEYGRQIIRISTKETKKALIIMNDDLDDNSKNMILSGINETITNEGNHLTLDIETMNVNDNSAFGLEEVIRDIFMDTDNQPDIIVCLDAQGTISACQAVVDYNLVGKVDIIGYHITDAIGNAIQRNVLSSTIVVDSRQMGRNSVDSLNEYIETGYVNDYIVMDVDAVTADNVREHMKDVAK